MLAVNAGDWKALGQNCDNDPSEKIARSPAPICLGVET